MAPRRIAIRAGLIILVIVVDLVALPNIRPLLRDGNYQKPKARTSEQVTARIAGYIAVLTVYTTIEQFNDDGESSRWNKYRFMRTYALENGEYRLLAGKILKFSE